MDGFFSFLLFAGLFYVMMRFGCGAHMVHGHHGGHAPDADDAKHVDPVCGKGYPPDMVEVYERLGRLPSDMILPGDMDIISEPTDFLGINFYTSLAVDAESAELDESEGPAGVPAQPGFTEMGWRVDPEALRAFLRRASADWSPPPMIITENGASYSDGVSSDGRVHDARRTAYLSDHIDQIDQVRREGVEVDGYFVWSFLDNLEWVSGFDQRFGIVHVDHTTQRRTIKDSGYWYRDRIASTQPND